MDTVEGLQAELAGLKRRYLSSRSSDARDNLFAIEESALGERFRKICHPPSYPPGFLEGLRSEGIDADDLIPF